MSLATRSLATMSLTTIVPRDKFYNRLKHKKPRIIIQIRDLHCLLGLVISDHISANYNVALKAVQYKPLEDFSSSPFNAGECWKLADTACVICKVAPYQQVGHLSLIVPLSITKVMNVMNLINTC